MNSVFMEVEFFGLITFSIILPSIIYAYLMWKKSLSRFAVLLFALGLIAISGIDIVLLQRLAEMAKSSPSLVDDHIFASQLSVALYLLPALFAGVGVNMISHVLISHLSQAEKQFERRNR